MEAIAPTNEEAVEAWDGVLFDRWVQFRDIIVTEIAPFSDEALPDLPRRAPASACSTSAAGSATRPSGWPSWSAPTGRRSAIDAGERFVETARGRGRRRPASATSASSPATSRSADLGERLRPRVLALRDDVLRQPGGGAAQRPRARSSRAGGSAWSSGGASSTTSGSTAASWSSNRFLEKPEETDEPTCGPGPFSMANADTTSGRAQVRRLRGDRRCAAATSTTGWATTSTRRSACVMAIGPAGELIRLAGDEAESGPPEARGRAARGLRAVRDATTASARRPRSGSSPPSTG